MSGTRAGELLLAREALNSRAFPLITREAIAAIEAEARKGYVPASLSPEWHAELNLTRAEGIAEGRLAALAEVEAAVRMQEPWLKTDAEAGRAMGEPGAVDVIDRPIVLAVIARLRGAGEAGT